MLWAYFNFSQFLIIWSGNLPEEITWYLARTRGGWQWLAHRARRLPLRPAVRPAAVAPAEAPRARARRASRCSLVVMRFVDVFWLVTPAWEPEPARRCTSSTSRPCWRWAASGSGSSSASSRATRSCRCAIPSTRCCDERGDQHRPPPAGTSAATSAPRPVVALGVGIFVLLIVLGGGACGSCSDGTTATWPRRARRRARWPSYGRRSRPSRACRSTRWPTSPACARRSRRCSTATAGSTAQAGTVRIPIERAMQLLAERRGSGATMTAAPASSRSLAVPRSPSPSAAPPTPSGRQILRDVGFDQRLGAQVPLDLAVPRRDRPHRHAAATTSATSPCSWCRRTTSARCSARWC